MTKTIRILGGLWLGVNIAAAAAITVHNTGVNSSDALVSAGALTSFWTLTAAPSGSAAAIGSNPVRYHNSAYAADTAAAAWVGPTVGGRAGALGLYTYSLSIDLTGLNPATASITGEFSTDNNGSIFLNNNAAVATRGSTQFGSRGAFTISSGFLPGLNTINVQISNNSEPTAFFVQFSTATADVDGSGGNGGDVPEPATCGLILAGAGVILLRRRY